MDESDCWQVRNVKDKETVFPLLNIPHWAAVCEEVRVSELQKLHLRFNWPAPRQQWANGTWGYEMVSPWKQELQRLYVSSFTAVCLARECARQPASYDFKWHVLPHKNQSPAAHVWVSEVCFVFFTVWGQFYQKTTTRRLSGRRLSFAAMAHSETTQMNKNRWKWDTHEDFLRF